MAARILHAALALELAHGFGGRSGGQIAGSEQCGARFDPELVGAFLNLEKQADFWQTLELEFAQSVILAMQPPTSADRIGTDQIEVVCEALADLVDIKTHESWNHSRIVAEVAVGMGSYLGLDEAEQNRLRYAALVHDIGNVAIPLHILEKGDNRSASEWGILSPPLRLHSAGARAGRTLTRAGASCRCRSRMGQWPGISPAAIGEQIPLNGRILAVADTYAKLTQKLGDKLEPADALRKIRPRLGT